MKRLLPLLLVPYLMLSSDAAFAQGRGHSKAKEAKKESHEAQKAKGPKSKGGKHDPATVIVIDRSGHDRVIREYYVREALPPGLAKRQQLPPGLSRQLRQRGALPPGLERYWVAVPAPLIRLLPPVPPTYHRYFVGNDLLIVDPGLHIIVDIVPGVLPPVRR